LRPILAEALSRLTRSSLVGFVRDTFGADLQAEAQALLWDPEQIYLAVRVDPQPPPELAPLLSEAARLLGEVGGGYRKLTSCVLDAPLLSPPMFLIARRLGPLMARPPRRLARAERPARPEAALNREHPQVAHLLALHARHPALAAYCLAKDLLLDEDRLLQRDGVLMSAAMRHEVVS